MTPVEPQTRGHLWEWLVARSNAQQRFRLLYLYGNFGGNLLGDTVISTQHLDYFFSITNVDLTIWTSDSEVWNALSTRRIACKLFVTPAEIREDFDLIFVDWCRVGPDLRKALEESRSAVLLWENRAGSAFCRIPGENWLKVTLPSMANQTTRIPQLHNALNWPKLHATCFEQTRGEWIYFNPYASTARKSLPVSAVLALGQRLRSIVPSTSVMVAPPPAATTTYDSAEIQSIQIGTYTALGATNARFLKPTSVTEYFKHVSEAKLVISPDTSSQHVAGILGVPSLTFYRASTGFNWYFWGWNSPMAFSIRLSETALHEDEVLLAGHIVDRINSHEPCSPFQNSSHIRELVEKLCFQTSCQDRIQNRDINHNLMADLMEAIVDQIDYDWSRPIKKEILQLCREIRGGSYLDHISNEDFLNRIRNSNAIRMLGFLCSE